MDSVVGPDPLYSPALMVADTNPSARAALDATLVDRTVLAGERNWADRLTSVPSLAAALLVVTALAAGPFLWMDALLAERWLERFAPAAVPFTQNVLDRVAGQAVCLPVLAAVAIILALRRRSWRPVLLAAGTEASFLLGIGTMKVLLGRGASSVGDPRFFEGGLLEMGSLGIAYPSGHASEAVLMYGMAVYLIAQYSSASPRLIRVLQWGVVAICVNTTAVSFLLGWHWTTDLVAGLLAGGLFLRLLIDMDARRREPAADAAPTTPTTVGRSRDPLEPGLAARRA